MKREIKEYPILFSTPMVQAILEGRKTQTRRVVKQSFGWDPIWKVSNEGNGSYCMRTGTQYSVPYFKCPYGQPGDVLWVRETFLIKNGEYPTDWGILYKSDLGVSELEYSKELKVKWKPSLFMPKAACRIFLRITNVRVERLHDINEADAKQEGVEVKEYGSHPFFCTRDYSYKKNSNGFWPGFCADTGDQFSRSFKSLWRSINGEQSWNDNPWVWVIEFERVEGVDL